MIFFKRHTLARFIFAVFTLPWNLNAFADGPAQPLAGIFKDCPSCPEMVPVPAGKFDMGSPEDEQDRNANESPQHAVTIAQPFAVGRYEVTFDEWDACVAGGGCPNVKDEGWGRGNRPVINVNWADAQAYATWLSGKTGQHYRLLTEAEWEYAARAGAASRYYWGNEVGHNNANCKSCDSQWDNRQTAPVGSFPPNAFGLHDMLGNVWEWVEDCQHDNYNDAPADGSVWGVACKWRTLRGGSWLGVPQAMRAANRGGLGANNRYNFIGFRLARVLP